VVNRVFLGRSYSAESWRLVRTLFYFRTLASKDIDIVSPEPESMSMIDRELLRRRLRQTSLSLHSSSLRSDINWLSYTIFAL
jgi:hypothetical protein